MDAVLTAIIDDDRRKAKELLKANLGREILAIGKGRSLGGTSLRELIDEGRR